MEELKLIDIQQGLPGVSPIEGANLYENCIVQLHRSGHSSPVVLNVDGLQLCKYAMVWEDSYNDVLERTYADEQSNVERSAVCISIFLALKQTPYTIIERSRRGTGFDYMLGFSDDPFFQPKARLEISGIAKETSTNRVDFRFQAKEAQTKRSESMGLPAYVSIVEFSTPKAKFDLTNNEA